MKNRLDKVENDIQDIKKEVTSLREFKHTTNGTLHTHNGKLDVITSQQTNTTKAIERLTEVVEDAVKKLGTLMTIKSMAIGAGLVIPPLLTAAYFLFEWYLRVLGIQ